MFDGGCEVEIGLRGLEEVQAHLQLVQMNWNLWVLKGLQM